MRSGESSVSERVRKALQDKDLIKAVHRYAIRHVPPCESEDLAQDALKRAFESADRFPAERYTSAPFKDAVKKWVWDLIRQERLKRDKKQTRRKRLLENRAPEKLLHRRLARRDDKRDEKLATYEPEPPSRYDRFADDRLRRRELRQVVKVLPERSRQIIEGWFFQEKPYRQLADELGINQQAARQRFHRALEALRHRLGELGYPHEGEEFMVSKQDFRLYLSLRYLEAIDKSDYDMIVDIWRQAAEDPRLAETLDLLDEQIELDFEVSSYAEPGRGGL